MEQTMKQSDLDTNGMHKSAIIYRDDAECYIYVCYHCGITFDNIVDTLQHIDSHYPVTSKAVDPFTNLPMDSKQMVEYAGAATEIDEFKRELMVDDDDYNLENACLAVQLIEPAMDESTENFRCKICDSINTSLFKLRTHIMRDHLHIQTLKCGHCGKKFKSDLLLESHLEMHIRNGDVEWKRVADIIEPPFNWSTYEAFDSSRDVNTGDLSMKLDKQIHTTKKCEKAKRTKSKVTFLKTKENRKASKTTETTTSTRMYKRVYRCHKCPQTRRYVAQLQNHLDTHRARELMHISKCKQCDVYFINDFELRLHVLEIHFSIKTFKCKACLSEFTQSEAQKFKEHLRLHNMTDGVCWTNICQGIIHQPDCDFTPYEECISFIEELHSCELCDQKFFIKSNLDTHIDSKHSAERRLECEQCGANFTAPKYYFAHHLEHQRVGPTISEQDDNVLLANLDAYIEERIVCDDDNREKPFRCMQCSSSFPLHSDVRSHVRKMHVYKMFPQPIEPNKEFICDLCGITVKSRRTFKTHLLVHTVTKQHPCAICGKTFRHSGDRTIHERQHTGEKPFQCHQCGKGFISKGLLTAHKKSHDDSTYPCKVCGREFNIPAALRRHLKIHREDRSFQCTICYKAFNTRLYLRKHMYTHNEKNLQCRHCELKFNTHDGRRQHERFIHKAVAKKN